MATTHHETTAAPIPADDAYRVEDLRRLDVLLTEPDAALDRVTEELAKVFDVPGAFVSFIDEDTQYYKSAFGGLPEEYAATRTEPREDSLCSYVVGMNDVLIVDDLHADVRLRSNPAVLEYGLRFYAGVPLRADSGRAVGSLCIVDTKPRTVSERERELLRVVAEGAMAMVKLQVASRQLLQRNERIERDLQQAVRVQQFLLPPKRLEGKGWQIEHLYSPVEHLGGDFIDVYERQDGQLAMIVADVVGHGTSAALTTAMAKTAFLRAASRMTTPSHLLNEMHRELVGTVPPDIFITAVVAFFAPLTQQITFASAGHPHPLHIRDGGRAVQPIELQNDLPLWVDETASYRAQTCVSLGQGDRVLVYTDGAVEAPDARGNVVGTQGFIRLVAAEARNAAREQDAHFLNNILAAVETHATGNLADDVALFCFELA